MNWLDIFDDVVKVMHTDYAGFQDKRGWDDPQYFRKQLQRHIDNNTITSDVFKEIVEEYLLDFKDGHLFFYSMTRGKARGFRVRRFHDKLYVTECDNENRVKPGDAIVTLDGIPIPQLKTIHRRQIEHNGQGQEREDWNAVLNKYNKVEVEPLTGEIFEMDLRWHEGKPYTSQYSFKRLTDNTGLITLTDFFDDEAINKVISQHSQEIRVCNLVIDVRKNKGGSDSAYLGLFPYIFNGNFDTKSLPSEPMEFNMTQRNYELRMAVFKDYLGKVDNPATKQFLQTFIQKLEKHKGEGLVQVDLSQAISNEVIRCFDKPERVVVLIDVFCGSSGDSFAETAKYSDKVTLMGRGTAGVTDYSNLASQVYNQQFVLMYATSRTQKIDQGKGLSGVGVQPDIHIHWTPDHIQKDIDLEQALQFLEETI